MVCHHSIHVAIAPAQRTLSSRGAVQVVVARVGGTKGLAAVGHAYHEMIQRGTEQSRAACTLRYEWCACVQAVEERGCGG